MRDTRRKSPQKPQWVNFSPYFIIFFAGISKKPASAAENVQRRVHRRKRGGRASRKRETAARLVRAQHNERADGSSLPALRRIQVQSATLQALFELGLNICFLECSFQPKQTIKLHRHISKTRQQCFTALTKVDLERIKFFATCHAFLSSRIMSFSEFFFEKRSKSGI